LFNHFAIAYATHDYEHTRLFNVIL